MTLKDFVALLALLFAALAVVGCSKDGEQAMLDEEATTMVLPVNIATRASATEAASDSELAIHEVRVYAFTGDKLAGHYYYSGDAVSKIGPFAAAADVRCAAADDPDVVEHRSVGNRFHIDPDSGCFGYLQGFKFHLRTVFQ